MQVSLADLIRLSRPGSTLSLQQKTLRALQNGSYLSAFKGRGMEFSEVRPYTPGDDVRSLDWRVTARTGKAHTKLFREERERPVFLSVDYRAAMFFATRGVFKSVMAARLAALVAWAAYHHGDRVGGQIFAESGQAELKPKSGKAAVLPFLKRLAALSEQRVAETCRAAGAGVPEALSAHDCIRQALSRLCRHARPGSLVFLVSDFRALHSAAESDLIRLSRHCDLVLLVIFDPLERCLPPGGRYRFSDGNRELCMNTAPPEIQRAYAQRFERRYTQLRTLALHYGMKFVPCRTTDDPVRVLQRGGAAQGKAALDGC